MVRLCLYLSLEFIVLQSEVFHLGDEHLVFGAQRFLLADQVFLLSAEASVLRTQVLHLLKQLLVLLDKVFVLLDNDLMFFHQTIELCEHPRWRNCSGADVLNMADALPVNCDLISVWVSSTYQFFEMESAKTLPFFVA